MQRVLLPDFDPASLASTVGTTSFAKGVQYAQRGAVAHVQWDPSQRALTGVVYGSGGSLYATSAYFRLIAGWPPSFDHGECSCPVGVDCKHAVALVLSGTMSGLAQPATHRAGPQRPTPPAWQHSLDSLLDPVGTPPERGPSTPLAMELTLSGH